MILHAPLPPRIFEHVSRKDWGRAVLAQEQADRRTFVFEDGTERSFRSDYWDKMEPVKVEVEDAHRIDRAARKNQPSTGPAKPKAAPKKPPITFEQQLAHFLAETPLGFDDVAYVRAERGEAEASNAAKLKDAGIARARETLGAEALQSLLQAGDFDAVLQAAFEALTGTKGTTHKIEAARARSLEGAAVEAFARALFEALHGEGDYGPRFDALVASFGGDEPPSWPVATLLPALVHPDEHVFVKPSFFKKQALVLDVDPRYDAAPNATTYEQLRRAALEVKKRLIKAGQAPRDLFDVHVFITKTLSPKAIKAVTDG